MESTTYIDFQHQYPVICAWCKQIIRYSTVQGSHGICEDCKNKMLAELKKK